MCVCVIHYFANEALKNISSLFKKNSRQAFYLLECEEALLRPIKVDRMISEGNKKYIIKFLWLAVYGYCL